MTFLEKETIATTPMPDCYLCGSSGKYIYKNLLDRLFGVRGSWHLKQCPKPECGLVWLDPMPTREDIGKAYENYYTHESFVSPDTQQLDDNSFGKFYRYLQDSYIRLRYGCSTGTACPQNIIRLLPYINAARQRRSERLKAKAGPTLLEVGCGSGELLSLLRSQGLQVQGMDIDPVAVARAAAKGLEVRWGSLADQAYPDEYFDIIVINHVIEHVHDPVGLLAECHRILRSRGRLLMLTPNLAGWGHRIFKDSWVGLDPPRHVFLYTSQSLETVTNQVGFRISSLFTSANNAKWFFLASRAVSFNKENPLHPKSSFMQNVIASGFAVLERALVRLHFKLGEEVVLEAEKIPSR